MKNLLVLLLLCGFAKTAVSQNCPTGLTAFQNKEYEKALTLYRNCLKQSPKDSSLIFMNGQLNVLLKDYKKAIPFLEKSLTLQYGSAANIQFTIGLCYAAIGEKDKSLSSLQQAAAGGFANFPRLDSMQFDNLRDTPSFTKIKKDMYENAFPCLKDPNNNKFDFWLGEWDVFVNGQKRADSKITKAMGGCAVHEDYVVLSGLYAGQSISYYDPAEKRWEQYWVGSAGDKSKYYETEKYDADMQFLWISKNPDSTETWTKMTYTAQDKNTVLQTLENSSDQGKTWVPSFSGMYTRKNN